MNITSIEGIHYNNDPAPLCGVRKLNKIADKSENMALKIPAIYMLYNTAIRVG